MADGWLGHRARFGSHCWVSQVLPGPTWNVVQQAQVQCWRVRTRLKGPDKVVDKDLSLGVQRQTLPLLRAGRLGLGSGPLNISQCCHPHPLLPVPIRAYGHISCPQKALGMRVGAALCGGGLFPPHEGSALLLEDFLAG